MTRLRRALDRFAATLLAALMATAVVNVVWQVLTRFVLGEPSSFTDEAARYLLVWIGLVGAAYAVGQRLHVAVDLVPAGLPRRAGLALALLVHAAVFGFAAAVLCVGGAKLAVLAFELGQSSAALEISLGWVYAALPVSGGLVMLYTLCFALEDWRERQRWQR